MNFKVYQDKWGLKEKKWLDLFSLTLLNLLFSCFSKIYV